MLEKEYRYFETNRGALLKKYKNKFIVIIGDNVVDSYNSQEESLREAAKKYKIGTFLIQKVSDKKEDTTQRFYSRVML